MKKLIMIILFTWVGFFKSHGQSTDLFGRYDLRFRCNGNTSQEVVFSLDIPKSSTNKYTIKSNTSGIERKKPFNCVATLEYNTTTNTRSGNIYMTKPSDRKFYRNDKFKIQFNGDDSGWFNLQSGNWQLLLLRIDCSLNLMANKKFSKK